MDDLAYTDDDITHVTASFGYMEDPDVPTVLRLAADAGLETAIDVAMLPTSCPPSNSAPATRPALPVGARPVVATSQVTADSAEYFGLRERTVIIGSIVTV